MLTGIEALSIRGDLLDRTVTLEFAQISSDGRRTEKELWQAFEKARPRILGALLDAVSLALTNAGKVDLPSRSRMADFEAWVVAAEPALGLSEGSFARAYARNRRIAKRRAARRDITSLLIIELVREHEFEGSATELLASLGNLGKARRTRLPATPAALGDRLRRISPDLEAAGVGIEFDRKGHEGNRLIRITKSSRKGRQRCQRRQRAASLSVHDATT